MKKQIIILSFLVSVVGYAQESRKKENSKEKEIEEVTIKKTKKAVEQKADRTVFDFSEQEHLNTGTTLDGIRKLPGMMSSDLTGMAYQGKPLAVYMDGRPLNISSTELNSFLEGLPASSIDRIEVITNPGAEFAATGGGAIMNIITSKSAKSYLTANYSGNYSFSNYDRYRNKTNQSILLNSKNKWFGWQVNTGVNYSERMGKRSVDEISDIFSDNTNRGYFARTAFTFDLGKDRLLLNYNISHNNNDELPLSMGELSGINYQRKDWVNTKRVRQEGVVTYQKRFNDPSKKLDFKLSYTKSDRDFIQDNEYYIFNSIPTNILQSTNSYDARMAEFKINYSQDINLLDKGKLSIGGLYDRLDYETEGNHIKNLDYQRQTVASFAEIQTSKGKWDFVLGLRGEDYDISGIAYNNRSRSYNELTAFRKYKFFPNASVQYNFSKMMNLALLYNKKINLPSISMLNPNSDYNNGSFFNTGNANLQPTIYDNLSAKFTAFNYFFISYDLSIVDNEIISNVQRRGDVVSMMSENVSSAKTHNFVAGIPLPLAIFNKPIKEIAMSNPDKMNLLYFVGVYSFQDVRGIEDNRGLWYFNINGQFVLPKEIRLNMNYTLIPTGSRYYNYQAEKPIQNTLNLNLSKKFLKNQLNVSLFVEDLFNTNRQLVLSGYNQSYIRIANKSDSRRFGISVNYKIPTKNKIAKEDPNMLLEEKKEGSGGFMKN